eukprot:10803717-Alexandrium_andersonii.AAC.1
MRHVICIIWSDTVARLLRAPDNRSAAREALQQRKGVENSTDNWTKCTGNASTTISAVATTNA